MRRILVVAVDRAQSLDIAGPVEVFSIATRLGADYETRLLSPTGAPIACSSGLAIAADGAAAGAPRACDTLLIAGGEGVYAAERDEQLIAWIARTAGRARRTASVCTGAFLLARAGLLDGRRATTHWMACEQLARRYPAVRVERDPIFVRDGEVATSAGVTAGMDLALALVEEDHGPELALGVARGLVLYVRRPGGQSQFSAQLRGQPARREPLRELQSWVLEHLEHDLSVPALAARAQMSERTLARAFRQETGQTPAAFVRAARLERARRELELGDAPIESIAHRCGFGTVETMRRAFGRRLGVPPSDYRQRFAA
jgi:transcriptional regulator GlxA family with amidase domain